MITLETLLQLMTLLAENECLEFKEAKQQFDTTKLMRYCVALANEGGGYLVLGVTDKLPRMMVGSKAVSFI
jgi:ATP-dependent DNA helicase RecG